MQHYGEAIEEVAKQVETSNRYTANQLYNQNLKLNSSALGSLQNGIQGSIQKSSSMPTDEKTLA